MNFPENLKYTKSHEWVRQEGDKCVVGITEYAQKELSDVVYVELPKADQEVKQAGAVCIVESVKAAFDIYAPISGKVLETNGQVETDPSLVNQDPYGEGWFFSLSASDVSELETLMSNTEYEQMLAQETKS